MAPTDCIRKRSENYKERPNSKRQLLGKEALNWSGIPCDVVECIIGHLCWADRIRMQAVCKAWSVPSRHIPAIDKFPWALERYSYWLVDPFSGDYVRKKLVGGKERLRFIAEELFGRSAGPLDALVLLPELKRKEPELGFQVSGFSLNATSPECFIILLALGVRDHKIHVNLCSPGDISWRTFEFNSGIEPDMRWVYVKDLNSHVLFLGQSSFAVPAVGETSELANTIVSCNSFYRSVVRVKKVSPAMGLPHKKDANYYKNLIQQNGEKQEQGPAQETEDNEVFIVSGSRMHLIELDNCICPTIGPFRRVWNAHVSIVGDFSEEEIESCILDYLGTIRASRNSEREHEFSPIQFRTSPSDLQFQQKHNSIPRRETMFGRICKESFAVIHFSMGLLAEVINSRFFTTVRDSLGLTYLDVWCLFVFNIWFDMQRRTKPMISSGTLEMNPLGLASP
ncbi:hypothetical protein V6N11_042897 [Hibiscus sabdariffa]|uniref:Peptidase M16 C-terminal domain-containing protein n=1 Tax=Hibiscus sabdariffa TaxID=183260 RepID=A0ABR2QXT2_9ROSI